MDVFTLARVLWQRWYVVVPVLAVTALAVVMVIRNAPETYSATGSIAVVERPPLAPAVTAGALAEIAQDGDVQQALVEDGATATYEVTAEDDDGVLRISATAPDGDNAIRTVAGVLEQLQPLVDAQIEEADVSVPLSLEILRSPGAARLTTDPVTEAEVYVAEGAARLREQRGASTGSAPPPARQSREILTAMLSTPEIRSRIQAAGGVGELEAATAGDSTSPVVGVTANATDPDVAVLTVTSAIDVAQQSWSAFLEQAGAAPTVAVEPLIVPERATLTSRGSMRPVIALAAVGAMAALGLALAIEGIAQVRRRPAASVEAGFLDVEEYALWDDPDLAESASQADDGHGPDRTRRREPSAPSS